MNLVSREAFEHSSVALGLVDSPGYGAAGYRGLAIASPRFADAPISATFAAEVGRNNGPFDNPEGWDRYKLFNKLTLHPTSASTLSLTEMSYSGNWHGSGQIPARAVEEGLISRFGSIDPDEGGNTARHQLALAYRLHPTDTSELRVMAYVATYRFNLFSNFTLFLRDPDNGDEIEQVDRRTFYGGKASYRIVRTVGRVSLDTTIGADARSDDIHEELWDTLHRRQLAAVRSNDVHETLMGAYFNEEITPAKWLRADVGGRADLLSFAVDNRLPSADPTAPTSGVDAAHQLSPKASLIVTPLDRPGATLDLYANYGHGFHSNDVRGVFATPAVTPLARAKGEELRGPRAPLRPLGSRGGAVAARPRERDRLERRRRHDGRERSDDAPRDRARDALRADAVARRRPRAHVHQVALLDGHGEQRRRPGARAQADLGGRALRPPRARAGRRARRAALLRHRRSPCDRRRRAHGARLHAGRSAPRLAPPLVRRRVRHREPLRRRLPLGAVRDGEPPAHRARRRRTRARGLLVRLERAPRGRADRRPLLRLPGRRLHACLSPDDPPARDAFYLD